MKIHTFYGHVDKLNPEHEQKLILLWRQQWFAMGWTPIVLNEYMASKHPLYPALKERIDKLPSVNPGNYEYLCFIRWLAMAQMGGGFMADYDLFLYNKDWDPAHRLPPTKKGAKGEPVEKMVIYQGHVPCLVFGTQAHYEKMVQNFIDYEVTEADRVQEGKLHVSDMYVVIKHEATIEKRWDVKMYGEDHWDTFPLVHYSTSTMTPKNLLPRYQHITKLRK